MTTFANKKVLGVLLGVAAAIVLTACGRSEGGSSMSISDSDDQKIRATLFDVFGSIGAIRIAFAENHDELMAKGGACRADPSYPDLASDTKRTHIAKVEFSDAGAGSCKITFTLGQFQGKESVLSGGRISMTSKKEGDVFSWTCSSDLPDKYLPKGCSH